MASHRTAHRSIVVSCWMLRQPHANSVSSVTTTSESSSRKFSPSTIRPHGAGWFLKLPLASTSLPPYFPGMTARRPNNERDRAMRSRQPRAEVSCDYPSLNSRQSSARGQSTRLAGGRNNFLRLSRTAELGTAMRPKREFRTRCADRIAVLAARSAAKRRCPPVEGCGGFQDRALDW